MDNKYKIAKIKVSLVKTQSAGADYTDHAKGHWINDRIIANPNCSTIQLVMGLHGEWMCLKDINSNIY